MRGLRKHEKLALEALIELVMGNMLEICNQMGVSYTSTRRSVKSLEVLGYVWMISVGDRGPKSPQTYMMTPLGYLAVVVYSDGWSNSRVHERHSWVCPRFIHQYKEFTKAGIGGLVMETGVKVLQGFKPVRITREHPEQIKIQRHNIDIAFITQYQRHYPEEFNALLKVCSKDPELMEAWHTWNLLEHTRRVAQRQALQQLPNKPDTYPPSVTGRVYPGPENQ